MKQCVIIAGGNCDLKQLNIESSDFIIAADSGYDYCVMASLEPDLIIGDFDSLKSDLPSNIETIKLPEKKDDTDLLFALRTGLSKGFEDFLIFGGYGSRPDQNFAMLQSLYWLLEQGKDIDVTANCNNFSVSAIKNSSKIFSVNKNQYISVFALENSKGVTINGAEYSLDNADLSPSFPIGVSNTGLDDEVTVSVKCGTLLVMVVDKNI